MVFILLLGFGAAWVHAIDPPARLCELKFSPRHAATFALAPGDLRAPWSSDRVADRALLEKPWWDEPSYSSPRYEISLLGSASTHEGAPTLVLDRLRAQIDLILGRYATLGFVPQRKLHVFLALNQGELFNEINGPSLITRSGWISINGRGERRTRRVGRDESFLVLPYDEFGGPLLNRFVLAHELAHAVVRTASYLLDEATSDWLASVVTGQPELRQLPLRPRADQITRLRTVRDIRRPQVAHADDLAPRLDRSHSNSTLLSNLFRELALLHGPVAVAKLIAYLEANQARMLAVADVADRLDFEAALPSVTHVEFVKMAKTDLGDLVHQSVRSIAVLIQTWAKLREIDVGPPLRRRGLLPER